MKVSKGIVFIVCIIIIVLVAIIIYKFTAKTTVNSDSHDAIYNEDNEYTLYSSLATAGGSILGGLFSNIGKKK